jgi:hypothetical protein
MCICTGLCMCARCLTQILLKLEKEVDNQRDTEHVSIDAALQSCMLQSSTHHSTVDGVCHSELRYSSISWWERERVKNREC